MADILNSRQFQMGKELHQELKFSVLGELMFDIQDKLYRQNDGALFNYQITMFNTQHILICNSWYLTRQV